MSWNGNYFELRLNFIDFTDVIKDAFNNWEHVGLIEQEYEGHFVKDEPKYEKIERVSKHESVFKRDLNYKPIRAFLIEYSPLNSGHQVTIFLKFGDINDYKFDDLLFPKLEEDSIVIKEIVKQDYIYTELWHNMWEVQPFLLRKIKGTPLNLKKWFKNIYSKWVDFNKTITYPIY